MCEKIIFKSTTQMHYNIVSHPRQQQHILLVSLSVTTVTSYFSSEQLLLFSFDLRSNTAATVYFSGKKWLLFAFARYPVLLFILHQKENAFWIIHMPSPADLCGLCP